MSLAVAQLWLGTCCLLWLVSQRIATCNVGHHHHEEGRYPCAFIDTTNITGSYHMGSTGNGSYVHNWTVIPKELVAAYDFVIENGIRLPVQRHLRACLCRLKPCVRFCCPSGQFYDLERRHCTEKGDKVPDYSRMAVALNNGTQVELELATHFTVHIETPCDHMRAVTNDGEYLPWLLHEVSKVKFTPGSTYLGSSPLLSA